MAINLPSSLTSGTPKAFFDILALQGGQGKLPKDTRLLRACAAAYAVTQAGLHLLEHGPLSSLLFGLACAALLAAATWAVLSLYKRQDIIVQTITALTGYGAFVGVVSIFLHLILAVVLPPPLPTHRLVGFLLFPVAMWNIFGFAYIYRHCGIRLIPAFAFAAAYIITVYFIIDTLIR